MKVDTGAEVTATSDSTWKSLNIAKQCEETKISLYGSDHIEYVVRGVKRLSNKPVRARLPITLELLGQLRQALIFQGCDLESF